MNTRKILATITIVLSFGLTTSIAHAAVDMFLSFPDSDVEGESLDPDHQNEIDVLSWSWALKVKPAKIVVRDLKILKYLDSATSSLVMKSLLRENLGRAVLTIRKPPSTMTGTGDYLVLTFENVTVSSYATGAEGGVDRLIETIGLAFEDVTGVYTRPTGPSGETPAPIIFDWDIASNESP